MHLTPFRIITLVALVGFALTLAACATTRPLPTAAIAAASQAITTAEKARAAEGAAAELGTARDKLAAAQDAVQRKDNAQAQRLAEQSRVEAEYAIAKSELVRATAVNDEMIKSNLALEQELQRNTGARP